MTGSALAALAHPTIWELSRRGLDLAFGIYRRRMALMRKWGLPRRGESMLDLGCGIGQFSTLATGAYLGIDHSQQYIDHARGRYGGAERAFRVVDAAQLVHEGARFDLVLMVDFLHHLSDEQVLGVLGNVRRLARDRIVSFEPELYQTNPIGQWIIDHDRGDHIRPLTDLEGLLNRGGLRVVRSDELRLGPIKTGAILATPT